MSEHKKGLSVDVLVGDLAGDHRVEAREGGHQVREADRAQVLEVFPVQMGQLLRQEVGVLCRGKRKLAGCLRGFPYMTSAEKGEGEILQICGKTVQSGAATCGKGFVICFL